ncbi:MAG: hypothetical protein OEV86_13270 [Candidatus Krumholzibacteria bacterium]|nr:hypothetical protein [Candidatus Krumholzibacteria bacterium]
MGLALILILMARGQATTLSELPKAANAIAASSAFVAIVVFAVTERAIAIAQKRATGLGRLHLPCVVIGLILLVLYYS